MAKIYIAEQFVRVGNDLYSRGEVLPDGLKEETVEWLLKTKAIRESVYEPDKEAPEEIEEPKVIEKKKPKAEKIEPVYVEEEAPEIDVMEGIVKPKAKKKTAKGGGKK